MPSHGIQTHPDCLLAAPADYSQRGSNVANLRGDMAGPGRVKSGEYPLAHLVASGRDLVYSTGVRHNTVRSRFKVRTARGNGTGLVGNQ